MSKLFGVAVCLLLLTQPVLACGGRGGMMCGGRGGCGSCNSGGGMMCGGGGGGWSGPSMGGCQSGSCPMTVYYRQAPAQQTYAPVYAPAQATQPAAAPGPQQKVPAPMLEDEVREFRTKLNPDLVVYFKGKIQSVDSVVLRSSGKEIKAPVINGYMPQLAGNVVRYDMKIPFAKYKAEFEKTGFVVYQTSTTNKIAAN